MGWCFTEREQFVNPHDPSPQPGESGSPTPPKSAPKHPLEIAALVYGIVLIIVLWFLTARFLF